MVPLADWLARQLANPAASQFVRACAWVGIAPGIREASRWRRGEGAALLAAWRRWPRSKTLPRLGGKISQDLPPSDDIHVAPGPRTIQSLRQAWDAANTGRMSFR